MKKLITILLLWVATASANTAIPIHFVEQWSGDDPDSVMTFIYVNGPGATFVYDTLTAVDSHRWFGDSIYLDLDTVVSVEVIYLAHYPGLDTALDMWSTVFDSSTASISADDFNDDAAYMLYGGGVWVDDSNGTAGAVVGVNGTPTNPVSGFSDAKTIADAIGLGTFYILGGGYAPLTTTLEGYNFIGMGAQGLNTIDLNSADVDGSYFTNLVIMGVQGGTGRIRLQQCALEGPTLYAIAFNCGLRSTITLNGKRDNLYDNCYSAVPANGTPSINFSGGSESIMIRHYSGGIHLFDAGANDSISIETDGQVQIGAACNVNAKISVRGMTTVTDSTAGLNNLTYTATAQYLKDEIIDDSVAYWSVGDSNSSYLATSIAEILDSVQNQSWAATGAGCGTGPKSVVFFAIDTSASPDDTVEFVNVFIQNAGQTANMANGYTEGSPPSFTAGLTGSTTYNHIAVAAGYFFAPTSFSTTAGVSPDTVAIQGYAISTTATPASHQTTLIGQTINLQGDTLVNCRVEVTLGGSTAMYSSTNTYPSGQIVVYSDGNGDWSATIVGTDSLSAYIPEGANVATYCVKYKHPMLQNGGVFEACGLSIPANGSTTELRDILAQ